MLRKMLHITKGDQIQTISCLFIFYTRHHKTFTHQNYVIHLLVDCECMYVSAVYEHIMRNYKMGHLFGLHDNVIQSIADIHVQKHCKGTNKIILTRTNGWSFYVSSNDYRIGNHTNAYKLVDIYRHTSLKCCLKIENIM